MDKETIEKLIDNEIVAECVVGEDVQYIINPFLYIQEYKMG
jgi:hypothetical protein